MPATRVILCPKIFPNPQQLGSNKGPPGHGYQPVDPTECAINAVEQLPSLLCRVRDGNEHADRSQVGDCIEGGGHGFRVHEVRPQRDDDGGTVNRPNVDEPELRHRVVDNVAIRPARPHKKEGGGNRPQLSFGINQNRSHPVYSHFLAI
jgi:hypothetical protein